MSPTVKEQLLGTCRILETVVAPCVGDPFARTILDNLIANLRMVIGALPLVAGFLRGDNEATLLRLLALRDVLPPGLVARIDAAASAPVPDVADGAALEDRNRLLRELLAAAVCEPGLTDDLRRAVEQHMIDRASRVPMRFVPTVAPASRPDARP